MTADFGNKIKIRVMNPQEGFVIARFSWEGLCWRRLNIVKTEDKEHYILQSPNKWEQTSLFKFKKNQLALNSWINVEVESLERKEG